MKYDPERRAMNSWLAARQLRKARKKKVMAKRLTTFLSVSAILLGLFILFGLVGLFVQWVTSLVGTTVGMLAGILGVIFVFAALIALVADN